MRVRDAARLLPLLVGCSVLVSASTTLLPVVPGAGLPGTTFGLRTWTQGIGQLLSQTYRENQVTPDGRYRVPDGMMFTSVENAGCSLTANVSYASSFTDWYSARQRQFSVSGDFKNISGVYTEDYQRAKRATMLEDRSVFTVQMECSVYRLTALDPVVNTDLWVPYFQQNVPTVFNASTQEAWYDAIGNNVGTHVVTSCLVGGRLEMQVLTTNSYIARNTAETGSDQAKLEMLFKVSRSSSYGDKITQDFKDNSAVFGLRIRGGELDPGTDGVLNWANGIINLTTDNLDCVSFKAVPVSVLLAQNAMLSSWAPGMELATKAFLTVPGCTNPVALNYNWRATIDDGSCEMTVPNCSHIYIGPSAPSPASQVLCTWLPSWFAGPNPGSAVYMVPGPDSAGNCVVAWACQEGLSGSQVFGQTAAVLSSPQLLTASRSDDWGYTYGHEHFVSVSALFTGCQGRWGCTASAEMPRGTPVNGLMTWSTPGKGSGFANVAYVSQPYNLQT